MQKPIVAVDFDGTLFDFDETDQLIPIEGAKEALEEMRQRGYHIVIHTCRMGIANKNGSLKKEIQRVTQMLDSCQMPFDQIYLGEKLIADVYVDDRGVNFSGDWKKSLQEVDRVLHGPADEEDCA